MKKRIISFLTAIAVAVNFSGTAVYAHEGDVYLGSYIYDNQKDLKLRITKSAQTSLMNSNVYNGALSWNNLCNGAHVSVIMETTGMPTISNSVNVYDSDGTLDEDELGWAYYYDSNGEPVKSSKQCAYATISINTTAPIYNEINNATEAARMNFIHEVGHVLMLAHPERSILNYDHTINGGYPYAVMNKGIPNHPKYPQTAPTPTTHDKFCLNAKWG